MADYAYKEETENKGMSPMTIAFLGAVAGAVGTGVAMALSNPQNRKKVQQTMKDGQQWIDKTISNVKQTGQEMGDKMSDTANKLSDKTDQKMQETKNPTEAKRASLR